jgi:DNA-binding SARP family transcriptional activator
VSTDLDQVARQVRMAEDAEPTDSRTAIGCLARALRLYRGDFCDIGPYDEWALVEREHHHSRRLDIALRLARLQLASGQAAGCLETCRLLLAEDRHHEPANMMAMRAHARLGQHHLALRQFERYRRELRAELAIDPGPSSLHLYEAIRRRERV